MGQVESHIDVPRKDARLEEIERRGKESEGGPLSVLQGGKIF